MTKKNLSTLTDKDKKLILKLHQENTSEQRDYKIHKKYGVDFRTARRWIEKLGYSEPIDDNNNEFYKAARERSLVNAKYYILTSAQNATEVHSNFWNNILAFKEKIGAELHVSPYKYKNPTTRKENKDQESESWWDERVVPYLDLGEVRLHKNLIFVASNKIAATSPNPLAKKETVTGVSSAIFAHPRQQIKSLPVLKGYHKKRIMTTGTCTELDYSETNAGFLGRFHHTLGFVLVEIRDNDIFHARCISADKSGNFIDVAFEVTDGVVSMAKNPLAIILGDLHIGFHKPKRLEAAINLYGEMYPNNIVLHDIFDGVSINPHEKDNPINRIKLHKQGKLNLESEINLMMAHLTDINNTFNKVHIVKSNHDVFLDRYINSQDWRKDIMNGEIYLQLATKAIYAENGLIPYLIEEKFGQEINCLGYNSSLIIGDYECGLHGDKGSNGAKGSPRALSSQAKKTITAHGHGYWLLDGSIGVGTCTEIHEGYAKGLSSWGWADAIINANGKAQLLIWEELADGSFAFTTLLD